MSHSIASLENMITCDELARDVSMTRPHVVLLGAGASKAAFPYGDADGRVVPLMDDLAQVVPGLDRVLADAGIDSSRNFEEVYSGLVEAGVNDTARSVEKLVQEYFSSLRMPSKSTLYDHLLLSLRSKDAMFTFNWDPFLFDAYERNRALALPQLYFLHGNVRVGCCNRHRLWGPQSAVCPLCSTPFEPLPLLYPVRNKRYSDSGDYMNAQWENARGYFRNALIFTVFGYSAPSSDAEAMRLLNSAWDERGDRLVEHVEIIDRPNLESDESQQIQNRWQSFVHYHHVIMWGSFEESLLSRFPRRTCESFIQASTRGLPSEIASVPRVDELEEIQQWYGRIAQFEGS